MSKILVVDDDTIMLMIAKRILSKEHEVICAKSGVEAIEIFDKVNPDLILSDLMMPNMDGYELHRILQEKHSELVPIIFMTADESDAAESKGFEVGAADYIRKPLKADLLLKRISKALENVDKIQDLKNAASVDLMTGLLNKNAIQKEISALLKDNAGVLLMMDLDSFKLVNDVYGHSMGDKVLVKFSDLVRHIIRETDVAGRFGGDEFIAYLQNIEDENILKSKVEYLNTEILKSAKKLMGEDMNISLGVSVGAVFSPEEGKNFDELYKKADDALYKVKQHGKHGLSVYGTTHHEEHISPGTTLMKVILGERTHFDGAYFVDFEHFKTIYRLMVRVAEVYKKHLSLMELDVPENFTADSFREKILHSLRRSDCVTQNGKNKFLILLPETREEEIDRIKNRLLS